MLKKSNHEKKYLLTHSMGGAIGMTYLEQNPNDFNAAAFSSPMLGFVTPTWSIYDLDW
jgi:lysophospholipase